MDRELAREAHGSFQPGSLKSVLSINRALLNMSNQRFFVLCGSGFQGNLTQATVIDSRGTQFADQCNAAIATRRAWAVPLAAAGAVLLCGLLLLPPHQHSTNFE
jgi:hypothetical protein